MEPLVEMPKWAAPLFEPYRYKVMHGGRGSSKSWTVATYLVSMAAKSPTRVLCAREFQKSIKESAHKLIADRINSLGLSSLFEIGESFIRGVNGSEFLFMGLKHNVSQIKSLEGIDKAWVEEGQNITEQSLEVLIPTIRNTGSEIIITFNPENDDDAVYKMFVVNKMPNSWVIKVNYDQNPWFPKELEFERANMEAAGDKDKYAHIWLGECRKAMAGAIYGEQMAQAKAEGRLTRVPYTPAVPVITAWDLGYSDATAIWFLQLVGREPRCIDYYENNQMPLDHYVQHVLQKPYNFGQHVLPHDAGHKSLRTGKTLEEQAKGMGLNNITVLQPDSVEAGIELVRQLIPQCWYDAEKCADGIKALTKYHYEYDDERKIFRPKPVHDWSSNGADAKRTLATYLATLKQNTQLKPKQPVYVGMGNNTQGWMA